MDTTCTTILNLEARTTCSTQRRRCIFLLIAASILSTIVLIRSMQWSKRLPVSILLSNAKGDVPSVERPSRHPLDILFVHHYPSGTVDSKKLCSVESAARAAIAIPAGTSHRPHVYVYASHVPTLRHKARYLLQDTVLGPNIIVEQLNIAHETRHTPLETFISSKELLHSIYARQNECDGVRLALLYNYGGIYLDMDVIVTDANFFTNVSQPSVIITEQSRTGLNNAWLKSPPQHDFMVTLMERFVKRFKGDAWGANGPILVTDTITDLCGFNIYRRFPSNKSRPALPVAQWCHNINILPHNKVTVGNWNSTLLYEPLDFHTRRKMIRKISEEMISVHFYNNAQARKTKSR